MNSQPFAMPKAVLKQKLLPLLEVDLGFGDLSSGMIPAESRGIAKIKAKSDGILAGVEESSLLFELCDVNVTPVKKDGEKVVKGDIVFQLDGPIRNILMAERTALNFLMHLSSIASSTKFWVDQIHEKGYKTIVATTRKVIPGIGWFEKKAVWIGGGDTHRWNLSDMVMLKDTHLKYYQGDIQKILAEARRHTGFTKKIEIEIEDPKDLSTAITAGADIIMLDNMQPPQIEQAIKSVQSQKPSHVLFEASGNITHKNFLSYAASGVDIISTSELILHPHIAVDLSLRLD